ncbi:NUDIX domain-containing protein [Hylemonella gracilis]|uniref:NUDIX hydrolase n=1 Tax=Hylemonella gracilis TaxID=80880 RepID=UPI0009DEEC06
MRTPKAVPIVLRHRNHRVEVLVFLHPQAGTQLVKGTIEPGESVAQASTRELAEESGILGAQCVRDLGTWEQCPRGQVWHFREMAVPVDLADSWSFFTEDAGGHLFEFSWHPLDEPAPSSCHAVFVDALDFLRKRIAAIGHLPPTAKAPGAA